MAKLVGQFSGFEQDMAALEKQVKDALLSAGAALQEDMKSCLSEHVNADVYEAYEPAAYVRREHKGGLLDMSKNTSESPQPQEIGGNVVIQLNYEPSGDTDGNGEYIDPHVDGDVLIERIERREPDYNWNRVRDPGDRPFFRNFEEEMISGRAEEVLVREANAADPTIEMTATFGAMELEDDDYH